MRRRQHTERKVERERVDASMRRLRVAILAAAGITACDLKPLGELVQASSASGGSTGSGSSTTSGVTSSAATTSTGMAPDLACPGSTPVLFMDSPSGFSKCPDGTLHRVAQVACSTTIAAMECAGTETTLNCKTDADCIAAPNGKCITDQVVTAMGIATQCGCSYACSTDDSCAQGKACLCFAGRDFYNDQWSECVQALCRQGSDCASNECALAQIIDGCNSTDALACHTPSDACRTSTACSVVTPDTSCTFTMDAMGMYTWACIPDTCIVGRPFVVDGSSRTAAIETRTDWLPADEGALFEYATRRAAMYDGRTRAALAAYWSEVLALEHASIASFARFALQLLALGAPAHLIEETHRAALDEAAHARMAGALASGFAERTVGPGRLEVSGYLGASRSDVLRSLVEDACVGEMLGVADALAARDATDAPWVASVFDRIAEDELRHGALAWKALAWLLRDATTQERALVNETFDRALARARIAPEGASVVAPNDGLLDAETIRRARARVAIDVIAPARDMLLSVIAPSRASESRVFSDSDGKPSAWFSDSDGKPSAWFSDSDGKPSELPGGQFAESVRS